jgi:hypothetical protein
VHRLCVHARNSAEMTNWHSLKSCIVPWMPRREVEVKLYSFFNLGARWVGWSTQHPGRLFPGKWIVFNVQKTVWTAGPVWTGGEKPPSIGFDPLTVQPVVSRYTGYAIPALLWLGELSLITHLLKSYWIGGQVQDRVIINLAMAVGLYLDTVNYCNVPVLL